MKPGVALAALGLLAEGSAFVPSFNPRQSFSGNAVVAAAPRAVAPYRTRQTRQVLKAVAAAAAVSTEVLTRVSSDMCERIVGGLLLVAGARGSVVVVSSGSGMRLVSFLQANAVNLP